MRALEWVLVVVAAGSLVATVRRGPLWQRVAPPLALALGVTLVLHAVVDGTRWQLAPVYLLAVGLVLAGGVRLLRPERPRTGAARVSGMLLALVGGGAVVLSTAVAVVLPVPVLPSPTPEPGRGETLGDPDVVGLRPWPVGTTTWVLESGRVEPIGPDAGSATRSLPVQAWYPADRAAPVELAPWIEDAPRFGREVAGWLGLPPFVLDHLALVASHATADAPLTDEDRGPAGVLLLSHGWGGFRSIQTSLVERLAAQGWVVVAPDHVHGAVASRFPDPDGGPDRVVGIAPSALPDVEDVGVAAYDRAAATLVDTYADDVLDVLADLASDAPAAPTWLADAVDVRRTVLAGHSTGGGAVVAACDRLPAAPPRRPGDVEPQDGPGCVGVVGYDPWVEPVATLGEVTDGLDVPFLAIRSEAWVGNDNDAVLGRMLAASADGIALSLAGTEHRDVTMFGFLSPFAEQLGITGSAPVADVHDAVELLTQVAATSALEGGRISRPDDQPLVPTEGRPGYLVVDDGLLDGR